MHTNKVSLTQIMQVNISLFLIYSLFLLPNYDTSLAATKLDIHWGTNAESKTDKRNVDFN